MKTLKVALLGCGNVGAQVARILLDDASVLEDRAGARLELSGIAVRNVATKREGQIPAGLFTTDAESLVDGADIVIELLGGLEPAGALIARALARGASVITGNKALIADRGAELSALAFAHDAQLRYEAAVAGAIPILRPISDSLSGDTITKVMGIVNGTTNFILDAMDTTGAQFADVLAEAQALGYAEADPTADVEGHDAAAKATILASLAFHTDFALENVYCEGISKITAGDVAAATDAGMVIKLLAIAERAENGIGVRVHPTLLRRTHPLAAVHGAFNAVFVEAQNAGELKFYGRGAGGSPTASAVLGDTVAVARRVVSGGPLPAISTQQSVQVLDFARTSTSYAIGLRVSDEPGVLAAIATIFAKNGVSIETLRQSVNAESGAGAADLRIVTHRSTESALAATVASVAELEAVQEVISVLRVEGN